MRCVGILKVRVATFFFEEYEFFIRVATMDPLSYHPLLNLYKIPPRPRAIASGTLLYD
jgi:hypothetical protein